MPLTNPHLISRPIAGATGTVTAANQIILDGTNLVGVATGAATTQAALERVDGTGIGAAIETFTGNFTAQASNIATWFGDRQQTRLRCTDDGGVVNPVFSLPGTTALTTAFDQLVAASLPEVIRFVIEYTDTTGFLRIQPRDGSSPQIGGTSAIIVRPNIAATLEITRTSGTISDFVWQSIGGIGSTTGGTLDAIKLINPSDAVWDASTNGTLPTNAVVKGNAYQVVNAPADGTGRFNEVMLTDDWVVWDADSFTSWSAEPHQWFVIPAHDVRRVTALEKEFLNLTQTSTQSDRNDVTRGTLYADDVGEIRLKLYATRAGYSAADLNTTGDIDEYVDPSDQTAFLGIRLQGNQSALASTLPTLYVYSEDGSGNFTRIANLDADFTFEGDFGAESDYLSREALTYNANDTWRIYYGTIQDRFNNPNLDISYENLDANLQSRVDGSHGTDTTDEQRIASLESKMDGIYPLRPDVDKLEAFAAIWTPEAAAATVVAADGYSLFADYRGDGTRYESAGVTYDATGSNVVRYTGLGDSLYRTFGFKVNAVAQVDDITLTGTSGTANINVNSVNYLATFNTNLTTTASDFVTTHATALDAAGVTVTSNAAVLTFTAKVGGTAFTIAAPVNATGDLAGSLASITSGQVLMWIVDGSELIPYFDTTASGTYRVNNYTPSTTEDEVITNQQHYITTITGQQTLNAGTTDTATFTATPFPASATHTSRIAQLGLDVFVNGSDTQAEHIQDITLPADNSAQAQQIFEATIFLGPLHGNRNVTVTMGYSTRVSGMDLLVDVVLLSAPSDVTIHLDNVFVFLSYTAPATTARVDNFVTVQDAGGDYTFTGTNEVLLTLHPFQADGFMEAVTVARDSGGDITQLNDVNTPIPHQSFASVEIPDQAAFAGFEFRTFAPEHYLRHSDLAGLLSSHLTTQWCYGLALLTAITEHVIDDAIDFTDSIVLIGSPNNTRVKLIVDDTDTGNIKLGVQEV